MHGLSNEFSFIINGKHELIFYATKHDYLDQYIVSWLSEINKRIYSTHYNIKDVEDLLKEKTWIIKEIYG